MADIADHANDLVLERMEAALAARALVVAGESAHERECIRDSASAAASQSRRAVAKLCRGAKPALNASPSTSGGGAGE